MKTFLLVTIGLLLSANTYAQDIPVQDLPITIQNSFNKTFPKASKIDWKKREKPTM